MLEKQISGTEFVGKIPLDVKEPEEIIWCHLVLQSVFHSITEFCPNPIQFSELLTVDLELYCLRNFIKVRTALTEAIQFVSKKAVLRR